MSELIEKFKTWDKSDAGVSILHLKHPKSGKPHAYFSLTSGASVTGVFLTEEIAEKMINVLQRFFELSGQKQPVSKAKEHAGAAASGDNNKSAN